MTDFFDQADAARDIRRSAEMLRDLRMAQDREEQRKLNRFLRRWLVGVIATAAFFLWLAGVL